ncbi:arsenic transporter [Cohnella sp. CFH 77786]|uniref:arsenic transporter n=1 Tax=Cohnella sp. CFH 77786 TaxID=2662265 RepID=UPI001C610F68|nr:arsenic transporter [Cohnella sp. CFH 77786]
MHEPAVVSLTIFSFLLTVMLIMWRPKGLNEAIPATGGALLVLMSGSVVWPDLVKIGETVSGAAITIIATIVIAMVLESIGFFHWAAEGLAARARGSGYRLFVYVNLVCFLMTLFFNNDGSILITTPMLIILLNRLGLKNHQKIPYLLSGALIATASSAPIGVSNIVNLISLKIVGMDLYMYTLLMFVPAMLGLLFLFAMLFAVTARDIPRRLNGSARKPGHAPGVPIRHPLMEKPLPVYEKRRNRLMFRIFLFVFLLRMALFVASYFGIPIEIVAVTGSVLLLGWRWWKLRIPPTDMLKKTPWHILLFAFGMYVIIYGLNNIGLTELLVEHLKPAVSGSLLNASLLMGGLVSLMSTLFNNHPALMIGTLALTQMNLDPISLKIAYLANVVGSDIGSLLLPVGTLASLIWLHILRTYKVKVGWKEYVRVTVLVIPTSLAFTLITLYYWVEWMAPLAGLSHAAGTP